MSTLICKYTGIILKLADNIPDNELLFVKSHPLATYSQVVATFQHRSNLNDCYSPLIAGSILSVLRHHKLLKVVGDNADTIALHANNAICEQSKKTSQLLAMLHRLINQDSRLSKIAQGYKVAGEATKREFQFCLESCLLQGHEKVGMNEYFLQNLQDWVNDLLPPTTEELLMLASKNPTICRIGSNSPEVDISEIELEDGSMVVVQYTDVVEAIKNSLEDEVYKKCRRMMPNKLGRKLVDTITLMQSYGIYNATQIAKLKGMIKDRQYSKKLLGKAVDMIKQTSMHECNAAQRNKMFEAMAWLKASDIEFQKDADAFAAFRDVLAADIEGNKNTVVESLQDRIARLKLARSK